MTVAPSIQAAATPEIGSALSGGSVPRKTMFFVPRADAGAREGEAAVAHGAQPESQWKAVLSSAGIGGKEPVAPADEAIVAQPARLEETAEPSHLAPAMASGTVQAAKAAPLPTVAVTARPVALGSQSGSLEEHPIAEARPDAEAAPGSVNRASRPASVKQEERDKQMKQDKKSKEPGSALTMSPMHGPPVVPLPGAVTAPSPVAAAPVVVHSLPLPSQAGASTASDAATRRAHPVPLPQAIVMDPSNQSAPAVAGRNLPEAKGEALNMHLPVPDAVSAEPRMPQPSPVAESFLSPKVSGASKAQTNSEVLAQAPLPAAIERATPQGIAPERNPAESEGQPRIAPSAEHANLPASSRPDGSPSSRGSAPPTETIHTQASRMPAGELAAAEMARIVIPGGSMATAVPPGTGNGHASESLSGMGADGSAPSAAHTAQAAFAAMDSAPVGAGPTWVRASARQAEAGWQDPALGWVSVRAEASAGGIHAALVGGSATAAQSLSGHLAGLNAYLQERQTPVQSLHVTQQGHGWAGAGSGGGLEQGGQGQNSSGDHSPSSGAPRVDPVQPRAAPPPATGMPHGALHNDSERNGTGASGRHLSVIA